MTEARISELTAIMVQLWKCDSESECKELARKMEAKSAGMTNTEVMKAYLAMRRMIGDTDCFVFCPDGTTVTPDEPGRFA